MTASGLDDTAGNIVRTDMPSMHGYQMHDLLLDAVKPCAEEVQAVAPSTLVSGERLNHTSIILLLLLHFSINSNHCSVRNQG